jgi:hypothetical protein
MKAVHGLKSTDGEYENDNEDDSDDGPPLKKQRGISGGHQSSYDGSDAASISSASRTLAFIRWLVGSYHPLDLVHSTSTESNRFAAFCKSLNGSYSLPTLQKIIQMADQRYRAIQEEIRQLIATKECDSLSVSVRRIKVRHISKMDDTTANSPKFSNEQEIKTFFPVQFTFCTSDYERKSFAVAVIEDNNKDGMKIMTETEAAEEALSIFGIDHASVMSIAVLPSKESENMFGIKERTQSHSKSRRCVIDELDEMVLNCVKLCLKDMYEEASHVQTQKQQVVDDQLHFTHQVFQSFQSANETGVHDMSFARPQVLAALAPFKDAIDTLMSDSYPTLGLTVSVLRRVQNVLSNLNRDEIAEGGLIEEGNVEEGRGSVRQKTKVILDDFLNTIQLSFAKTFKPYVEINASAQWTVPLDPRLVLMKGLSENEQKKVKESLSEAVKALVFEGSSNSENGSTNKVDETAEAPSKSTTMGGLFLGDSKDTRSTPMEAAEEYSNENVESYFRAVSSHRRINDSLKWWKNNQTSFPELAELARKWMATSTVYAGPNVRPDERNAVITMYCEDEKDVVRAIFLHDNQMHI